MPHRSPSTGRSHRTVDTNRTRCTIINLAYGATRHQVTGSPSMPYSGGGLFFDVNETQYRDHGRKFISRIPLLSPRGARIITYLWLPGNRHCAQSAAVRSLCALICHRPRR
jgi:hypothetical protein